MTPEELAEGKRIVDNLEAAISEFLQFQGRPDGFLVDWVLIGAQHIPLPDGTSGTHKGIFGPMNQPNYRAAGLVRYAANRLDKEMLG